MLENRDVRRPYNDLLDGTLQELELLSCTDAATPKFFTLHGFKWITIVFAALADAANGGDGSCRGGCHDRVRSLCKAGRGVMPTWLLDSLYDVCSGWVPTDQLPDVLKRWKRTDTRSDPITFHGMLDEWSLSL